MEKLAGDALDLRFRGHPLRFGDGPVKNKFCTFCVDLLECLSEQQTSCTDFKLENVGFVKCESGGSEITEFRLIDVDSIGALTFTPGYMPFSGRDAGAFFRVLRRARAAEGGPEDRAQFDVIEKSAKWCATVHAVMICVAIFHVNLQGHDIHGTLVLLESLKFNQRMQLLEAILRGPESDRITQSLWGQYGAKIAGFDAWALKKYAELLTSAGGRNPEEPDTLVSMRTGLPLGSPQLRMQALSLVPPADLWERALSDEEKSFFSDDTRMNARTELAIRLLRTHSTGHRAPRAMPFVGAGPRSIAVHDVDTGRTRFVDLGATALGGGPRRSREDNKLATVEEGPLGGGYPGGGYRP